MENNQQETPVEVLAPSAIMAMERAQIDTQVATAHQYPRSLEQFKKRALSMATLDEETAESCIYCRPVGKEQNDRGQWVEKYAEGPSIRLGEIVAASYGNIRVASRIVEQTERFVRCEGVAHDLESNYAGKSECMESTVTREGKPYSERQRALIAKVCLAKAFRDAIFKVVPRALCKPVFEAAKKVSTGQGKPLEERRKKARAWVSSLKIDESRVFAALGVKGWNDVSDDHLIKLTGLKTAIGDGDETIETIFPKIEAQGQESRTKPAETAHQQATQPKKPAEKPAETQKAPETPPVEQKPAPEPAVSANKPLEDTPKAETTAEKPVEDDNLNFDNAGGQKPPEQPATPKPEFVPNPQETAPLQNVRRLLHDFNKTDAQLIEVLRKHKAMKDEQHHINELSEKKLTNIATAWRELIKEMA